MSHGIGSPLLYTEGQRDVLRRLRGDVPADEEPMAPIAREVERSYMLWCIGHNLAVIGALAKASGRHRGGVARAFASRRQRLGLSVDDLALEVGLPDYEIAGFEVCNGVGAPNREDRIRAALDKLEAACR